jgi:hypothetical protein
MNQSGCVDSTESRLLVQSWTLLFEGSLVGELGCIGHGNPQSDKQERNALVARPAAP